MSQTIVSGTLIDPNGQRYRLDLNVREFVISASRALSECAPLSYFPPYHLEAAGKRLDDMGDFRSQGIGVEFELAMTCELLTEQVVREYVTRLKFLMKNPPIVKRVTLEDVYLLRGEALAPGDDSLAPPPGDFLPDLTKLPTPPSALDPLKSEESERTPGPCLNSMEFSSFNPPAAKRWMKGDISYLTFHTLENEYIFVTCCSLGFFVNHTKMEASGSLNVNLNPKSPVEKSIPDLLFTLSPLFICAFRKHLASVRPDELMRRVNFASAAQPWVTDPDSIPERINYEDWTLVLQSEGLTAVKEQENIHMNTLFGEMAVSIARDIIHGKLPPKNPFENQELWVYMFKNLFFSFAQDVEYRDHDYDTISGSVARCSHIIHSLQMLVDSGQTELPILGLALVQYRGFAVFCEMMLPGLISSDNLQKYKYGSNDEGIIYRTDPDFHEAAKRIGESTCLAESRVLDAEGKVHEIALGYTCVGYLGNDGQKYFLENSHPTPRDANKPEILYENALLRPELVRIYVKAKVKHHVDTLSEELVDKKMLLNPDEVIVTKTHEGIVISEKEYEEIRKTIPDIRFNPNVFTGVRFEKPVPEEEAKVKELSRYLIEVQIPMVSNALCTEEGWWPRRGVTIVDVLHQYGVNARYLWAVAKCIVKPEHRATRWQCEIVAMARSAKRVMNYHMREAPQHLLNKVVSDSLNSIFGFSVIQPPRSKAEKRKRKKKAKRIAIRAQKGQRLDLSPEVVWEEMCDYSHYHFGMDLPDRLEMSEAMMLPCFRVYLLREICVQTGIQLDPHCSLSEKFTRDSISGLTPRLKMVNFRSRESEGYYGEAITAIGENRTKEAIELLYKSASTLTNLLNTFVHKDVAACYQRIGSIHFSAGEYPKAILNQHRAIAIFEKSMGLDHPVVADSYVKLAEMYRAAGRYDRTHIHLIRALQLYAVNGCQLCPEALSALSSLAALYQQQDDHDSVIIVLEHLLDLSIFLHGDIHRSVAECCEILSCEYKAVNDVDKAIEYQIRAVEVFKKVPPEEKSQVKEEPDELEKIMGHKLPWTQEQEDERCTFLKQRMRLRILQARMHESRAKHHFAEAAAKYGRGYITQDEIEEAQTNILIEEIAMKSFRRQFC